MSAPWPGSMRGPRVKTPRRRLLLLLLLLLSSLSGTVLCQDEEDGADPEPGTDEEELPQVSDPEADDTQTSEPPQPDSDATSASDPPLTDEGGSDENTVVDDHGSGQNEGDVRTEEDPTLEPEPEEGLSPIIILIPVVLVVVIIGMIVCGIFINRRWNRKARPQEPRKEDPYLDESSTEKVPMPMFEEDVPSVLELEMEELDQWMKKDG